MLGKFLGRLRQGLSKTREGLLRRIGEVVRGRHVIDEEMLEEIEEVLIEADVGVDTTMTIIDRIRERVRAERIRDPERIQGLLKEEMLALMIPEGGDGRSLVTDERPYVIMLVGVNGTGKTTTIGKLAYRFRQEGKKVVLAACDTFRAAGIEQLEIWAKRTGADIVRHQRGADPASVAFDALSAAEARGADVLIIDTAGRLHTKVNLMEELRKISRVLGKRSPGVPHEVWLVLDATTGQNAIAQTRQFGQALGLTGLILAKLDGTAKGGVVIAIKRELDVPVRMIGIGEKPEDLRDFDPEEFVEAVLGE